MGLMLQIGFLTEWQLYAQKIEGDSWVGDKLDPSKIEKMSGKCIVLHFFFLLFPLFPLPMSFRLESRSYMY